MTRVRAEHLETGAVTSRAIRRGAVGRDELDPRLRPGGGWWQGAIGQGMLAPGAVIPGNLAPGAVQAPDLEDDAVTAPKIRDGSVTGPALADGSVTGPKVPAGALGARELADGSLTVPKFAEGTRPVQIVNSLPDLPSEDHVVGDLVVNLADSKAYRLTLPGDVWDATDTTWSVADDTWPTQTWDATVDTIDLRGLLAEQNFGDDLIVARMVAADQIGAQELAAITMEVDKFIRSFNWDPGVDGWAIDGSGNAEFNDVTVRGNIEASSVTAGQLVSGTYTSGSTGWALDSDGNAEFEDVTIRGGSVVGAGLVSDNYTAGSNGWALDASGNAEFNDATFRGNIKASSVTSGQLVSSSYTSGVTGWALDANGNAEFEDITIRGGSSVGADLYSSSFSSGSYGWAILSNGSAEFNDVTIRGSTVSGGTVSGATFQTTGTRGVLISGSGESIEFGWTGSGSSDGSIRAAGDFGLRIGAGSYVDMNTPRVLFNDGSASSPSLTFGSDQNTGIFRPGADILGFATGGTEIMRVNQFGDVNPSAHGVTNLGITTSRWDTVACVTLNESSDVRDKTIDGPAPGLDLVRTLNPIAYHRKGVNRHQPAGKTRLGLTAQQLAEVLPVDTHDVVAVDDDGVPSGIAYTQLIAPLVAAVQELDERLAAVETLPGVERGR